MSLRILVVNTGILSVPPQKGGAIEMHTYYLANELARLGNDVHYVTSINKNAKFDYRVTLHRLPELSFSFQGGYPETILSHVIGGFLSFLKASRAIEGQRYDVVHGHDSVSTALLLPLTKRLGSVFTVHNATSWTLPSSSALKQALRRVAFSSLDLRIIHSIDRMIAVSEQLKTELVNRLEAEASRVKVIPNGVDTKIFQPIVPGSTSIRKKYGIDGQYSLFVGRLVEQKGVRFLIEAIVGTRLHAVIVGGGPLLSHLQSLSRRLEVDKQIHFVGAVPSEELPSFYAEASTFVIPSLAEGLPLVGLEAMASGLPLIGTDISGIEDIIRHGHNGFRIKPGDTAQLQQRLIQLFEDASLRKTMGAHSREIAQRCYSWEQVAKRTLELYQTLV